MLVRGLLAEPPPHEQEQAAHYERKPEARPGNEHACEDRENEKASDNEDPTGDGALGRFIYHDETVDSAHLPCRDRRSRRFARGTKQPTSGSVFSRPYYAQLPDQRGYRVMCRSTRRIRRCSRSVGDVGLRVRRLDRWGRIAIFAWVKTVQGAAFDDLEGTDTT